MNERVELDIPSVPGAEVHLIRAEQQVEGRSKIVLINGINGENRHWHLFPEELAVDTDVLLINPRGVVENHVPSRSNLIKPLARLALRPQLLPTTFLPRISEYSNPIIDVLDYLEEEKVHVVGQSMGGLISQDLAIHHPDRVDKLVLAVCPTPKITDRPDMGVALQFLNPVRSEKTAGKILAGDMVDHPELLEEYGLKRKIDMLSFLRQVHAVASASGNQEKLSSIKHETLIIYSDDDPLAKPSNARVLKELIPNSTLLMLKKAGHLALLSRYQECAQHVRDHINGELTTQSSYKQAA